MWTRCSATPGVLYGSVRIHKLPRAQSNVKLHFGTKYLLSSVGVGGDDAPKPACFQTRATHRHFNIAVFLNTSKSLRLWKVLLINSHKFQHAMFQRVNKRQKLLTFLNTCLSRLLLAVRNRACKITSYHNLFNKTETLPCKDLQPNSKDRSLYKIRSGTHTLLVFRFGCVKMRSCPLWSTSSCSLAQSVLGRTRLLQCDVFFEEVELL